MLWTTSFFHFTLAPRIHTVPSPTLEGLIPCEWGFFGQEQGEIKYEEIQQIFRSVVLKSASKMWLLYCAYRRQTSLVVHSGERYSYHIVSKAHSNYTSDLEDEGIYRYIESAIHQNGV